MLSQLVYEGPCRSCRWFSRAAKTPAESVLAQTQDQEHFPLHLVQTSLVTLHLYSEHVVPDMAIKT